MAKEQRAETIEQSHPVVLLGWPQEVTEPCFRFLLANGEVVEFLRVFGQLAHGQENMMRALAQDENYWKAIQADYRQYRASLDNPKGQPEEIDPGPLSEMLLSLVPNAERLVGQYARLLNQMLLSRAVDNFNLDLSELLLLMYRTTLGAVKTEDTDIEEFIGRLAEQYVEGASLGGMKRLSREFKQTFGVKLFTKNGSQGRVVRIAAHRNIITHNRGIANRYFLKEVPDASVKVGEPVPFIWEDVRSDVSFLLSLVRDIDSRVAERFSLPRISLPPLQQPQTTQNDQQP